MKRLSPEALRALGSMTVDGRYAKIATQLDRKLYLEVNKALEALGGKWNRSAGGHLFEEDPEEPLSQVVANGGFVDKRQELGFFQTPEPIADRLVRELDIMPGDYVLEPNAGRGRIVTAVLRARPTAKIHANEIDPKNCLELSRIHGQQMLVTQADFLTFKLPALFDRVAMNPPFAKQADIDHVTHAMRCGS